MTTPTPEQLSKLPKWAQEHIRDLERQRDNAVMTLNKFEDAQTPSPISFERLTCTGEDSGGTMKRCYVQTHTLTIEHAGVWLEIMLTRKGDGQRDYGLQLVWGAGQNHFAGGYACFVPKGLQSAQIISREEMRVR